MTRTNLFIASLILFFSSSTAQQNGGIFYQLTTRNGLSSNYAVSVLQDKEGFYWITTNDGLNRFNGTVCKTFWNIKGDSTSLSHNHCKWLVEDDQNYIWVGTLQGLSRYDKKSNKF